MNGQSLVQVCMDFRACFCGERLFRRDSWPTWTVGMGTLLADRWSGDEWAITGVREGVANRQTQVRATDQAGNESALLLELTPRETGVLLAGGVVKYLA